MKTLTTILLATLAIGCADTAPEVHSDGHQVAGTEDTGTTDAGAAWAPTDAEDNDSACGIPTLDACIAGTDILITGSYYYGNGCGGSEGLVATTDGLYLGGIGFDALWTPHTPEDGGGEVEWAIGLRATGARIVWVDWHQVDTDRWVRAATFYPVDLVACELN